MSDNLGLNLELTGSPVEVSESTAVDQQPVYLPQPREKESKPEPQIALLTITVPVVIGSTKRLPSRTQHGYSVRAADSEMLRAAFGALLDGCCQVNATIGSGDRERPVKDLSGMYVFIAEQITAGIDHAQSGKNI